MATGWHWQLWNQAGEPLDDVAAATVAAAVPGAVDGYPSQSDAESWVGECWRELVSAGVDAVSLLEDDRVVYGPMSLRPAP